MKEINWTMAIYALVFAAMLVTVAFAGGYVSGKASVICNVSGSYYEENETTTTTEECGWAPDCVGNPNLKGCKMDDDGCNYCCCSTHFFRDVEPICTCTLMACIKEYTPFPTIDNITETTTTLDVLAAVASAFPHTQQCVGQVDSEACVERT